MWWAATALIKELLGLLLEDGACHANNLMPRTIAGHRAAQGYKGKPTSILLLAWGGHAVTTHIPLPPNTPNNPMFSGRNKSDCSGLYKRVHPTRLEATSPSKASVANGVFCESGRAFGQDLQVSPRQPTPLLPKVCIWQADTGLRTGATRSCQLAADL